jgi:hypothetical protein
MSRASVGCAIALGWTVVSTTRLVRHGEALLDQRHEVLLAEALAPPRQRGAIERRGMLEGLLATEELVIRVLDPARA